MNTDKQQSGRWQNQRPDFVFGYYILTKRQSDKERGEWARSEWEFKEHLEVTDF